VPLADSNSYRDEDWGSKDNQFVRTVQAGCDTLTRGALHHGSASGPIRPLSAHSTVRAVETQVASPNRTTQVLSHYLSAGCPAWSDVVPALLVNPITEFALDSEKLEELCPGSV
jgi:hypothetical protein